MENASFKSVAEIRAAFLNFFESHGHTVLPGGSLIPDNDPSILFTNAGMNQFKEIFLGNQAPSCPAATTAQWCLRAGGKHNDLENIGYTFRHHTLFEMLGNFSFGHYSKQRAIELAWEFLTSPSQGLGLPAERLWITVYQEDEETFNLWLNLIHVKPNQIVKIGDADNQRYHSDNFWKMGETGPCGPSTEIFYDYGPNFEGTPPGPHQTGERFIEIWNLVFMQFMQDEFGKMTPLPKLGIDTGMGLERIAAVLQNTHDNYQIDMFVQLMQRIARSFGANYEATNVHLRVIADHIRAISFLLAENVLPGNQGRGYVLRRIIRRAMLHAYKLGARHPQLYQLIPDFCTMMGDAGIDIIRRMDHIQKHLHEEECAFYKTLAQGLELFEEKLSGLKDSKVFSGAVAFQLYDTYGFPLDITEKLCQEKGITLDFPQFEQCMAEQKARSKHHQRFSQKLSASLLEEQLKESPETIFLGYDSLECSATVLRMFSLENEEIKALKPNEVAQIILNQTTFYPESGGQAGDRGYLVFKEGAIEIFDTQKIQDRVIHFGRFSGEQALKIGESVHVRVDSKRRQALAQHHSATHLLHAALKAIVDPEISQAGSSIHEEQFRFDFFFDRPLSEEELRQISNKVNQWIQLCLPVQTEHCDFDSAIKRGACSLSDSKNKYKNNVRLVSMGECSLELCGGTHVRSTGEIGLFTILSQSALARGVRRIEACTGIAALQQSEKEKQILRHLNATFHCLSDQLSLRVEKVLDDLKLEKNHSKYWRKIAVTLFCHRIAMEIKSIHSIKVFSGRVDHCDREFFKELSQRALAHLVDLIICVRVDGAIVEVFCSQIPDKNCNLVLKIENFLKTCGDPRGGGSPFQKVFKLSNASQDPSFLLQQIEKIVEQ